MSITHFSPINPCRINDKWHGLLFGGTNDTDGSYGYGSRLLAPATSGPSEFCPVDVQKQSKRHHVLQRLQSKIALKRSSLVPVHFAASPHSFPKAWLWPAAPPFAAAAWTVVPQGEVGPSSRTGSPYKCIRITFQSKRTVVIGSRVQVTA